MRWPNRRILFDGAAKQINTPVVNPATGGNTSSLPLATISVDSFAVTAATTEKHQSALPLATISLDKFAVTAATTEKNYSALPLSTISLDKYAPTAQSGDSNQSALPLATVSLDKFATTASTTEKNYSALPLATLTLQGIAVTAQTTESAAHTSSLPLATITLTSYAVTSVTTGAVETPRLGGSPWPVTYEQDEGPKRRKAKKRKREVEIVKGRDRKLYSSEAIEKAQAAFEDTKARADELQLKANEIARIEAGLSVLTEQLRAREEQRALELYEAAIWKQIEAERLAEEMAIALLAAERERIRQAIMRDDEDILQILEMLDLIDEEAA